MTTPTVSGGAALRCRHGATRRARRRAPAVFDAALAGRCQRLVRHDGVCCRSPSSAGTTTPTTTTPGWSSAAPAPTLDLGLRPRPPRGRPRRPRRAGPRASTCPCRPCSAASSAAPRCCTATRSSACPARAAGQHVVLADGNIGIGGDPVALLRRCRELLAESGTVLLELEPDAALWRGHGLPGEHRPPTPRRTRWRSSTPSSSAAPGSPGPCSGRARSTTWRPRPASSSSRAPTGERSFVELVPA